MITLASREAYRLWAPSYDSTPNPLLALEERLLRERLAALACGRVVDVGCGTGRWGRLLPEAEYVGIDICLEMIRQSPQRTCAAADAACLPLADKSASLTICSFAAGYLADLAGVVTELRRITHHGGFVVISDIHPDSGWDRSFRLPGVAFQIEHFARQTADFLCTARQAGLQLIEQCTARFGQSERFLFSAAGREDLFEAASAVPAIWAGIWGRP